VTNSTPARTEAERKRIGEAGGTVTRSHLRQGRTTDELIRLGDELEVGLLVVGDRGHGNLPAASGEAVWHSGRQLEDRAGELEGILDERPQTRAVAGDATRALLEAEREHEGPPLVSGGNRGLGMVQRVRLGSASTNVVRAGLGVVLVSAHSDEQPMASEEQIPASSQTTEEVAATRGESTRRRPSDG
jgi:nucleotide-binding universal stress UspA family protein